MVFNLLKELDAMRLLSVTHNEKLQKISQRFGPKPKRLRVWEFDNVIEMLISFSHGKIYRGDGDEWMNLQDGTPPSDLMEDALDDLWERFEWAIELVENNEEDLIDVYIAENGDFEWDGRIL